jgi:hypothetical protein
MNFVNENVIRARKENWERASAESAKRRDQFREARSFRAKNKASKASLLRAASRKISQVSLPQFERQSKLAGQESQ